MKSVLSYLDPSTAAVTLLVALFTLLLREIFRLTSVRNRCPPGPTPLPFIGTVLQSVKDPMKVLKSMADYGEMSTLHLGRTPMIVINTLDLAKEAFVEKGTVFSGRPNMDVLNWINGGYGIIMVTYGHMWKQQRRFALLTLRNFGLGKKSVEERVSEEAQCLIKEMLKQEGKAFDPFHSVMNAVSNVICSIVFGERFEYDDQNFANLLEILNDNIRIPSSPLGLMVMLFPITTRLPGPHQMIHKQAKALQQFIHQAMEEHKQTLDPENLRDFIDAYLVEISKNATAEDSTFHVENLIMSTNDLFLAGTETTSTTLRWGLIYMMNHPEIQERCHEEIVRVLGFDRTPGMDDRVRLPYALATVHEIQRYASIIPLGVVHETTQTTELRGYTIPKGTMVSINLTVIMSDKQHWKHPDTFNPDNFLDEEGQFCKNEFFLPFSLGPRVCLGETLARTELFIFFTSLLQKLKFSWPPNQPPIDLNGMVGGVKQPHPFQMICRSRESLTPC